MSSESPIYDLVLLLDPRAEEEARAGVLSTVRAEIEAGGELLRHDEWGLRALAYPIRRRPEAQYHLIQFHAGSSALLSELDRSLHLTDTVLRFMITKLKPGTPDPPSPGETHAHREATAPAEPEPAAA